MDIHRQKLVKKIPDFDVLAEDPERTATIIKESLMREGFKQIKIVPHPAIGEIIPEHVELKAEGETLAFIYKPIACHSYNTIMVQDKEIHVATIDTILTFYLAFIYTDLPYYDNNRLLCMAKFLFDVEEKNRLEQKGLLKRFSINCYGKQLTMEEMRAEKANKFEELMNNKSSQEYEEWFLKYNPTRNRAKEPTVKTIKTKTPVKKRRKTARNIAKKDNNFLI